MPTSQLLTAGDQIYRDMRHPVKWGKAVKVTFSFSVGAILSS